MIFPEESRESRLVFHAEEKNSRMGTTPDSTTNLTLLGRLRQNPDDPEAWRPLVDRYRPLVFAWCLSCLPK